MIILAFDPSIARTGWATVDAERRRVTMSGFFVAKGGDQRERLDHFRREAHALAVDTEAAVLAWEAPAIFRSQRASLSAARIDEILTAVAERLDLACLRVPVRTWRAAILGKGAGALASAEAKLRAVQYCRWLGLSPKCDDEAEAVCIGLYAAVKVVEVVE